MTRTFSKARGLAALRVGYAVCDPEITNYLYRVRQPFNVNKPALAAAEAALGDDQHLERTVQTTHEGMQYMVSGLEVRGIGYIPSRANFICIDVGDAVNAALAMRSKGILVTPLANYGMTQFIRVTIGTTSENESVMNAIEQCTLTN